MGDVTGLVDQASRENWRYSAENMKEAIRLRVVAHPYAKSWGNELLRLIEETPIPEFGQPVG